MLKKSRGRQYVDEFQQGDNITQCMHKVSTHFSYGAHLATNPATKELKMEVGHNTTRVASQHVELLRLLRLHKAVALYVATNFNQTTEAASKG
jgi:hypothetical protein